LVGAFFLGALVALCFCVAIWRCFVLDTTAYLVWAAPVGDSRIPRRVMQTYHHLDKIPQKVAAQFAALAPDYERVLYDDPTAVSFIRRHFDQGLVELFEGFRVGAFKADLFRYCYLYIEGGIYLDIKTVLEKPLGDIHRGLDSDGVILASCLTKFSPWIPYTWGGLLSPCAYQGIIFAAPRNPIFLECIAYMRKHTRRGRVDYLAWCKNFAERMGQRGVRRPGFDAKARYMVWEERLHFSSDGCRGTVNKKIPFCSAIYDCASDEKLFITRFGDFPWS